MTMGVERTLSLNASSSSREDDQFEDSFSIRSRFILSAPFSELREETFSFVDSVLLCLTTEGDLLVLKRTSEEQFSLVRKHDIVNSQVMAHPLLPDAMRVQAAGTVLVHVYQAVKDSTQSCIKKWMSKLGACKAKAKAKKAKRSATAANTHSRTITSNGPKAAKNGLLPKLGLGTKPKKTSTTTAGKITTQSTLSPSSYGRHYSSPSSPVAQHRSILSAAIVASRSQRRPESILFEEEPDFEEQLPREEQQEQATSAGGNTAEDLLASVDEGSCCDINDVVIITNGHCDDDDGDDESSPLHEAEHTTSETTEVLMLVNGHTDLTLQSNGVETGKAEDFEEEEDVELSNSNPLDALRELRSSFRLNLTKRSPDITRTSSDRFLGHHRALSAIEEGAILTKICPGSSSASRLDELKEAQVSVSFEDRNGHLCLNGGEMMRSHGSSTPPSPPLTPATPRTPSPLTPMPPSSMEANGFGLGGRFRHVQIRNRKVKCSPRINRSISVQTPPHSDHESTAAPELKSRSTSLVAVLTSSLVLTTPTRSADINTQR